MTSHFGNVHCSQILYCIRDSVEIVSVPGFLFCLATIRVEEWHCDLRTSGYFLVDFEGISAYRCFGQGPAVTLNGKIELVTSIDASSVVGAFHHLVANPGQDSLELTPWHSDLVINSDQFIDSLLS
jgi:hypothetical protein